MKDYDQYCPIAHSLGLVGERWTLLVVRELYYGPKRYTDLVDNLPGIGTNILASPAQGARGERPGREAPTPAAGRIDGLRADRQRPAAAPVLHELARFGARLIGPPPATPSRTAGCCTPRPRALAGVTRGRIAFRIGDEEASLVDGRVIPGVVDRLRPAGRGRPRRLLPPGRRRAPRGRSDRR